MDIIDVVLGRAQMSASQIAALTSQARQALAAANEALEVAQAASQQATAVMEQLDAIVDDFTQAAQDYVDQQLLTINSQITTINAAIEALEDNPIVTISSTSSAANNTLTITLTDSEGQSTDYTIIDYKNIGTNNDGSMTQGAIKTYVEQIKAELEAEIAQAGGCQCIFEQGDIGKVLVVGDNLRPAVSSLTEDSLIYTQMATNTYYGVNSIGCTIDYVNNTVDRFDGLTDKDTTKSLAQRCNAFNLQRVYLNNNGQEVAYDSTQDYPFMVKMPAFYYNRTILASHLENTSNIPIIDKEQLLISDTPQKGFQLHPLFQDSNGHTLTEVYVGAYEGSAVHNNVPLINDEAFDPDNDVLTSRSGVLPISGSNHSFYPSMARAMAERRGVGWTITNYEFESALQMLMVIEFQNMNIQATWNLGPTFIGNNSTNFNNALYTGSTNDVITPYGQATQSHNRLSTYTTEGKCSIVYHGIENPYGNLFRYIDNLTSINNNTTKEYKMYYNNNYICTLPEQSGWLRGFGNIPALPWAFIPVYSAREASSAIPIGDWFYSASVWVDLPGDYEGYGLIGGSYVIEKKAGPFALGFDVTPSTTNTSKHSARLMYHKEV